MSVIFVTYFEKLSMARNCHNLALQTDPKHCEEEADNDNSLDGSINTISASFDGPHTS